MGRRRTRTLRNLTVHKEQHLDIQGLEEHGYKVIKYRSKVLFLNNFIKTTHLDTVNTTILSKAGDFDRCVTLFTDFIKHTYHQQGFHIATANIGGDGSASKVLDY